MQMFIYRKTLIQIIKYPETLKIFFKNPDV